MELLLKDCLAMKHDLAWVEAFRKQTDKESLSVDEALEYIAKDFCDPLIMEKRLMVLNDDDISFFEMAMKKDIIPAPANYGSADKICNMDYAFAFGEQMILHVPEDVRKAYEAINTKAFHERRKKISWLKDCVDLSTVIYGVIRVSDLCRLYRKRKGFEEKDEQILLNMLPDLMRNHDCNVVIKERYMMDIGIADSPFEEKIKYIQKRNPISFPSYSEMKDMIENGYPSKSNAYQKLKSFFYHNMHYQEDYLVALLSALWKPIAKGYTYSELKAYLKELNINLEDTSEPLFRMICKEVWEDTRTLLCNGNKPKIAMPNSTYIFFSDSGNAA
ncbi:MAG: hypothetical protein IKR11_12170 [Solobacterium sp.]|nr:hypothetical protein [Solobacterium sp.]